MTSKKQLYTIEYPVRCSPTILWGFLSTPVGLQEWFADKVDEWEGEMNFTWGNAAPEKARIIDEEEEHFIKYHWSHTEKGEYFEFRIEKTEISNQTILVINDFAEKGEIKDATQLWDYQVKDLLHKIGG